MTEKLQRREVSSFVAAATGVGLLAGFEPAANYPIAQTTETDPDPPPF
jgi:hypothetical protein